VSTAVKDGHLHRSPEKTGEGAVVCTDSCKFVLSYLGRCRMRESDWIIPAKMLSGEASRGHFSVCVLTYYCAFPSLFNLCSGREKGGKSHT